MEIIYHLPVVSSCGIKSNAVREDTLYEANQIVNVRPLDTVFLRGSSPLPFVGDASNSTSKDSTFPVTVSVPFGSRVRLIFSNGKACTFYSSSAQLNPRQCIKQLIFLMMTWPESMSNVMASLACCWSKKMIDFAVVKLHLPTSWGIQLCFMRILQILALTCCLSRKLRSLLTGNLYQGGKPSLPGEVPFLVRLSWSFLHVAEHDCLSHQTLQDRCQYPGLLCASHISCLSCHCHHINRQALVIWKLICKLRQRLLRQLFHLDPWQLERLVTWDLDHKRRSIPPWHLHRRRTAALDSSQG